MADVISMQQYNDTVNEIRKTTDRKSLENKIIYLRDEVVKNSILMKDFNSGSPEYAAWSGIIRIFCMWAATAMDRMVELGYCRDEKEAVRIGYAEACQKWAGIPMDFVTNMLLSAYNDIDHPRNVKPKANTTAKKTVESTASSSTGDIDDELMEWYLEGNEKLNMIKLYKDRTGKSLKESKDYVEDFLVKNDLEPASPSSSSPKGNAPSTYSGLDDNFAGKLISDSNDVYGTIGSAPSAPSAKSSIKSGADGFTGKAKKTIKTLVILVIVGAVLVFGGIKLFGVIKNKVADIKEKQAEEKEKREYENSEASNYYTPEILKSYVDDEKQNMLTFLSCDENGKVTAKWEYLNGDSYWWIDMEGRISSKKNSGDLVISWGKQNAHQGTASYLNWIDEEEASISNNFSQLVTDDRSFSPGVIDALSDMILKTPADFQKLSGSSFSYTLGSDIDFNGAEITPISDFKGTLNGGGHIISNFVIHSNASNVGLFSQLSGTVSDLIIENAAVTVDDRCENIGILCGDLKGTISGISVTGTVIAPKSTNVGGICGYISKGGSYALTSVENYADVTGLTKVGGIAGSVEDILSNGTSEYTIEASKLKNSGTVTAAEDYAGGLFGYLNADTSGVGGKISTRINDSENTGSVSGRYYVGGILGFANSKGASTISFCNNHSAISGEAFIGCIAGQIGRPFVANDCANQESSLTATGNIVIDGERYAYVGGLVGWGACRENCTNYIDINYNGGGKYVGGVVGYFAQRAGIYTFMWDATVNSLTHKNLVNKGNIVGNSCVGGVIGGSDYYWENGCTEFTNVFEKLINEGSVSSTDQYAGGIAGWMSGNVGGIGGYLHWTFYDCTNSGSVLGNDGVGGLFGGFKNGKLSDRGGDARNKVKMEGCSSTGSVNGSMNIGELIGSDNIVQ